MYNRRGSAYFLYLGRLLDKPSPSFWWCVTQSYDGLVYTTLDNEFVRYCDKTTEHSSIYPNPAESEPLNLIENMLERDEKEFFRLQEIAERRIDELCYRFQHNKIMERGILHWLSVFIASKNKNFVRCASISSNFLSLITLCLFVMEVQFSTRTFSTSIKILIVLSGGHFNLGNTIQRTFSQVPFVWRTLKRTFLERTLLTVSIVFIHSLSINIKHRRSSD